MNLQNLSLAEIVTAKPAAAALFETLQLDFCCKGKQKLSEVLSNDQNKLGTVISKLELIFKEKDTSAIDYNTYSLSALIEHIVSIHHQYVKEIIPVIQQHLWKVVSKHGITFPFMAEVENIFKQVSQDLLHHMMKEEMILFPKIKRAETNPVDSNGVQVIINVMEREHLDAGNMMEKIKVLTNNYTVPENACVTFRICLDELKMFEADLHKHVHLENNILFPKAIKLSSDNTTSCSCSI
jgi:regulator of cell morphogenesis and NO signaling